MSQTTSVRASRYGNADIKSAQSMIYLGNVRRSSARGIQREARRAVLCHGRIAVFIGENGEAAAYSYRHVDFDRHCRVHAAHLVGTYEYEAEGYFSDEANTALLHDIQCHVLALPKKGAKAA